MARRPVRRWPPHLQASVLPLRPRVRQQRRHRRALPAVLRPAMLPSRRRHRLPWSRQRQPRWQLPLRQCPQQRRRQHQRQHQRRQPLPVRRSVPRALPSMPLCKLHAPPPRGARAARRRRPLRRPSLNRWRQHQLLRHRRKLQLQRKRKHLHQQHLRRLPGRQHRLRHGMTRRPWLCSMRQRRGRSQLQQCARLHLPTTICRPG